jgi:hypothetical protein
MLEIPENIESVWIDPMGLAEISPCRRRFPESSSGDASCSFYILLRFLHCQKVTEGEPEVRGFSGQRAALNIFTQPE